MLYGLTETADCGTDRPREATNTTDEPPARTTDLPITYIYIQNTLPLINSLRTHAHNDTALLTLTLPIILAQAHKQQPPELASTGPI